MALDDGEFHEPGDDDFDEQSRPWLPPEDRLWRHPSELSSSGTPVGGSSRSWRRAIAERHWPLAVSAGVVGAFLATGLMAATGHLGTGASRTRTTYARTTATSTGARSFTPVSVAPGSAADRGTLGAAPSVAQMAERVLPAMVTLEVASQNGGRRGAGLIVRDDGMILTTYRLATGSSSITAVTSKGVEETASVVGEDPSGDLALLHVDATGLPTVDFGQSSSLHLGELTVSVALPQKAGSANSVFLGTVDGLNRQFALDAGPPLLDAIETDAPPHGSIDGGPLLDSQGQVVGITSGTLGSGSNAHSVATPADLDTQVAAQLMATGHADYAWLGVDAQDQQAPPGATTGAPAGAKVVSVVPNSPATVAGLKAGDVITSINSHPVGSVLDLQGAVHMMEPGTPVQIVAYRDGAAHLLQTTLGSHRS